jgi:small subunit ribosomal protein S16
MVAIRLRREGAKNNPFYRIVVADSRNRRDGRFIEQVGTYNPLLKGTNFDINLPSIETWISKGAQPSETVGSIIKKARKAAKVAAAVAA